ncbi:MAG TPA: 30S ribosomal protein S12 methylthiotransferase RimO [Flavobacteriales bacterium]|nr:30S ribosomal protein S12 methylthiotransferase RimO [Flavobacteriales bacterium]
MKTKKAGKKRINIITLGCSKNIVDSEVLMGQLKANNLEVYHEGKIDENTSVVINTCGFIDNAKQESIDTILEYSKAKEEGRIAKLYVTGCLSERYKPDLEKEIPNVEEYFGTRDLPQLLKSLGAEYKHELIGERTLTTPNHFAYLKIAEGCDRPCSFCAIPIMRGKHISKPMEEIIKEAQGLARQGTKELILIAQELTYYGFDIYRKRKLADLLRKLNEVEGIDWIRLHYAYPAGFPMDVLDAMKDCDKVCNYIDIPLQHISDKLLKSMRRGITADKTRDLIKTFRKQIPGIAIRTTLILGYPGETNEDFELLKKFITDVQFDRLGVFQYSHEENTHAFQLTDDVPESVKEERVEEIMELQRGISGKLNQLKIGSTQKVLIDRLEGDYYIGRTEHDSPEVDNEVMINANGQYTRVGDFANIRITAAEDYDLIGTLV